MNSSENRSVPLLDLKAQFATIRDEIHVALDRVVEGQQFILGPEVEALEQEIAAYSQCDYAIGVSSGTDALLVALTAAEVGPGTEVITTPYTFFATAGSISRLGAKSVFVDIDPISYNIDPNLIEAAITTRTRAIIPVHLFGQMADMDPIMDIARRHHLVVIEDAAQAIGAEYKGQRAGSIGHLGCFSFFPSKNLGGFGDGGMVTTNDSDMAERVRRMRNHGSSPKYFHSVVGGNYRLDAIQAAILRVKLCHLDEWTEARQRNAFTYRMLFGETELTVPYEPNRGPEAKPQKQIMNREGALGIVLPVEIADQRHIYNQFVIRVPRRSDLIKHLEEAQIGYEIYYPLPLHMQECFAELGYQQGDLAVSELAAKETLALPIYPELTHDMQAKVVTSIEKFL